MPLFEFDDGTQVATAGTTYTVPFVDNGVAFTFSTSGGGISIGGYYPSGAGSIHITDFTFGGTWTLDVATASPLTDFSVAGLTVNVGAVNGIWHVSFIGDNSVVTAPLTTLGSASPGVGGANTRYTEIRFVSTTGTSLDILSLNATLMCYCAGTQIATPEGAVAVEDLRAGDIVLTADGRATEVTWLGRQPVDTRLTHPAAVNPICISAGALAENVPSRDLFVSPDHAIEVDGVLYQASALVNGSSITMVEKMPRDGFTYYHVETAAHELLLAENTPAESFVEMGDLAQGFENLDERRNARRVSEMALPRVADRRLVPAALREKLRLRAAKLAAAIAKAA